RARCVVPLSLFTFAATPRFPMIKRYSDHAANERTFLAWVRTAIAVMAFGFIIERFDLFLKVAASQLSERQLAAHGERFANWAGLAFSHRRHHRRHRRCRHRRCALHQDREGHRDRRRSSEPRRALRPALAIMIGLLGASLALYLSRAVLPTL